MPKSIVVRGEVIGGKDLIAELKAVGLNVKGTTRKGVRAGAKVIQAEAERRASALSKRGGKAVKIQVKARDRNSVTASIGPSKKKFYLRYLETGTQPHAITIRRRGGVPIRAYTLHHPGHAARPWLRPAFDATTTAAAAAVGEELRKCIEEKRAILDNGPEEE
jgi:HK97 gp10 family phage protein